MVGLGAVGSATLYQLSRRGIKALGVDRFHPPHDHGSSHGETRITRVAVAEGEAYVPLVRRSHEIWRELEAATGRALLRSNGGLIFGTNAARAHGTDDFLQKTIAVAKKHAIRHEVLSAVEMKARFPQFRFGGDETGYFEAEAGYVHPEACIATQLELARANGAQVRAGERVLDWNAGATGVSVVTDGGRYEADRLILCAGAWLPGLVTQLAPKAQVFRQVLFWFEPEGPPELFAPERLPVFIRLPDAKADVFYGFPAINGDGLKIAGEQFDRSVSPDEVESTVGAEEVAAMHALVSPHLRIGSRCLQTSVCKYTMTPDCGFVIDRHPESERVWFASACSGHGFKHSAAVGEALAEMVGQGSTRFDLSAFRLGRF